VLQIHAVPDEPAKFAKPLASAHQQFAPFQGQKANSDAQQPGKAVEQGPRLLLKHEVDLGVWHRCKPAYAGLRVNPSQFAGLSMAKPPFHA